MDLSDWLTEPEAAAKLGCSVKTIKRYAAAGKLETRKRMRPGVKPENVCAPRDIERLMPSAYVMAPEPEPEPEPGAHVSVANGTTAPGLLQSLIASLDVIARAVAERPLLPAPSNRKPKPEVPIESKVWLNLKEAVAFSGLPRRELRSYMHDGTFEAKRFGHRWRILRSSIERGSLR